MDFEKLFKEADTAGTVDKTAKEKEALEKYPELIIENWIHEATPFTKKELIAKLSEAIKKHPNLRKTTIDAIMAERQLSEPKSEHGDTADEKADAFNRLRFLADVRREIEDIE